MHIFRCFGLLQLSPPWTHLTHLGWDWKLYDLVEWVWKECNYGRKEWERMKERMNASNKTSKNGIIVRMIEIVIIFLGFVSCKVNYYIFQLSTISGHIIIFCYKINHLTLGLHVVTRSDPGIDTTRYRSRVLKWHTPNDTLNQYLHPIFERKVTMILMI